MVMGLREFLRLIELKESNERMKKYTDKKGDDDDDLY